MDSLSIFLKISFMIGCFHHHVFSFWWSTTGELIPEVSHICRRSTKYRGLTKILCEDGEVVDEIMRGVRLALEECQVNMKDQRWNCSNTNAALIRTLKHDTRESAYVRAIVSAGPIYTIVDACSKGNIDICECKTMHGRINFRPRRLVINHSDPSIHSNDFIQRSSNRERAFQIVRNPDEQISWTWKGCDNNIRFAYRISKSFIDDPERRIGRDFKSEIHLHNYEAGRLASLNHMRKQCRCHGMSGSCVMQTCWLSLPYFTDVAQRLKIAYKKATMVTSTNRHYNKGGKSMVPVPKQFTNSVRGRKHSYHRVTTAMIRKNSQTQNKRKKRKIIKKQALVFSQESPDYCSYNESLGSIGTKNRQCELGRNQSSGCSFLCCGRGFRAEERVVESSCECKFEWCCDILCRECTDVVIEYRCR